MNTKKIQGTVDMSTSTTGHSSIDMFTTPRAAHELDLVDIFNGLLKNDYSPSAAAAFSVNDEIMTVTTYNPISQRIIVNRWITICLLKYRSVVVDADVSEILLYAINDGTVDDWIEMMKLVIVPFFKKNNVLAVTDIPVELIE